MKIPIREYTALLKGYLKPYKFKVILLGLLLATSIGLQLANPQIVRYFIDAAKNGGAGRNLTLAALAFIGFSVLQQIVAVVSTYISQDVGWSSTNTLREDLLKHCVELDMSFHKSRQPGELIERLDGDVTALFGFFSKLMLNLINNGALLLGILVMLFLEDWRVGSALSFFAVTAVFVLWKIQPLAVKHWTSEREMNAKFFGFIGEQVSSLEDIRSSGAVQNSMRQFYEFLRKWYPIRKKANMMGSMMWITTMGLFAFGNMVAFGIGGYLWFKGAVTIGTVYLIFYYTELLNRPIEQIRFQLQDLQRSGASIARIKEIFDIKSVLKDGSEELSNDTPAAVETVNLSFEYEEDTPVLHDLSMKLEPGRVLGVLGRTGSGKTTLARLIVRLYDPTEGKILINGRKLDSILTRDLRQSMAYVTQDVQLFKATVRDNLTLFNPEIGDGEIYEALKNVGLKEWIDSMPQGLDTMLDSSGGGLSAGEAQLLAFVRVFLRNPSLVILDEASSRLDPITEQLIEGAIDKLLTNRTSIIIAHRLKTLDRADDILILDNGRILEYGNRLELLQKQGSRFNELLKNGLEEVLV